MRNGVLKSLVFSAALLTSSCSSSKKAIAERDVKPLSTKALVKNHEEVELDFKTLRGRIKVDYKNGTTKQGVTLSFRMEKDKAIWLSAPFGMFKAYMTPERISFYNKLEKEYFEGDFDFLEQLLGVKLEFDQVQKILLGHSIVQLDRRQFESDILGNQYRLEPKKQNPLYDLMILLDPATFKVALQQLSRPEARQAFEVGYTYQQIGERVLPGTVLVKASLPREQTIIDLDYKQMEFDRKLSFPYKIPNGYKLIE